MGRSTDGPVVSGRKKQNRCPRITIFALIDLGTKCWYGPGGNILAEARPPVVTGNAAVGLTQINDVRVFRIGRHVSALASTRGKPIACSNLAVVCAAYNGRASTIRLRAIYDVRELIVSDHMVELCCGLVVPRAPSLAAVEADCCALIGSENHAGGILGINPNLMGITTPGRTAHDPNRFCSVFGPIECNIGDVDHIRIMRIDRDAAEIPGATGKARVSVLQNPSIATVVRAI